MSAESGRAAQPPVDPAEAIKRAIAEHGRESPEARQAVSDALNAPLPPLPPRRDKEAEAKGDYTGAAKLRVKAALGEPDARRSSPHTDPSTFPASRAQAIGLELVQLSNSIQRDLTRAQTLIGELRGVASALQEKR